MNHVDADWIRKAFANIKVFRGESGLAPHKPLLLLLTLARVQRGGERVALYSEVAPALKELLARYNPSGKLAAHYPFWRLQNDEGPIWEIPEREVILAANPQLANVNDVTDRMLREGGARGGFPAVVDLFLRTHPALVNQLAEELLDAHFPTTYHDDILDAVGFPWTVERSQPRKRDPRFRHAVLAAYDYTCAVCRYDGRLGEKSLGIEAAHIMWHAAGGPDEVSNGLALCTFHHTVFDFGALGLSDDARILVSPSVNGREMTATWLGQFDGRPLALPKKELYRPRPEHIEWHRSTVFKAGV
jgi:putative restriction endonuclease